MDFNSLGFLFLQLALNDVDKEERMPYVSGLTLQLLRDHSVKQPSPRVLDVNSLDAGSHLFHFKYFMRTFKAIPNREITSTEASAGLKCYRQMAEFLSIDDKCEFTLIETRYTVAMLALFDKPSHLFNLVYILDPEADINTTRAASHSNAAKIEIQDCNHVASTIVFQSEIKNLLATWENDWVGVLDCIDGVLQVEVCLKAIFRMPIDQTR
jgi:hypothetical protein